MRAFFLPSASDSGAAQPAAMAWRVHCLHLAASPFGTPFSFFHPRTWSKEKHYGRCGQSCPCCRWQLWVETGFDPFGVCELCETAAELQSVSAAIDAFLNAPPAVAQCTVLCLRRAFRGQAPGAIRRIVALLLEPRILTLTVMQRVRAEHSRNA